ncbi:MAG: tRNA (adenosine(37)-N6)-threonylcarbamoyltransferase complex transferase subunit TsaD [Ruminococcaceae bacterium]|nr:tRNA (adenosine(37)-N6)-threonylcarbamoyltransferase complex transferase subunit TsaD [Oscillospiraceae bacterium]
MALILGIESSCDETAASVVRDGREVLSNVIASQIDIHKKFGGVVPEVASRKHLEIINTVIDQALCEAEVSLEDIDAIAVTYAPGLVGALLVGVSAAKALSFASGKPLIGVHHIRGHICANFIAHKELEPPFVCLVASGGHSHIIHVKDYTEFEILGQTRDDAAGEAFDKVARVLGLGYPGGPKIDKCAKDGNSDAYSFKKVSFGKDNFDFSFSGIKTGVINLLHNLDQKGESYKIEDIAASFQKSVCDVLSDNLIAAAKKVGCNKISIAGGVAANSLLRQTIEKKKGKMDFYFPPLILCTDNAAMIACSGYYEYLKGNTKDMSLNAIPYLGIDLK